LSIIRELLKCVFEILRISTFDDIAGELNEIVKYDYLPQDKNSIDTMCSINLLGMTPT